MFLEKLVNSRRSGVVAVETRDDDAVFFYHDGSGFRQETVPFTPMLLLSAPEQLEDFSGTAADSISPSKKRAHLSAFSAANSTS